MATTPLESSTPKPMNKSRVWVCSSSSSSFQIPSLFHLFCFFSFFTISISTPSSSTTTTSEILYKQHCNSIVPESNPNGLQLSSSEFLQLQNGYFHGGDRILGQNLQTTSNSPISISFRTTQNLYTTETQGVLKVEARLVFLGSRAFPTLSNFTYGGGGRGRSGRRFRTRGPHLPVRGRRVSFKLQGFWSESSGKLCMVGSSSTNSNSKEGNPLDLSAVLKLNYPNNSTIYTSLVGGTLESLDPVDNVNYFETISILGFSQRNYKYSFISNQLKNDFNGSDDGLATPSLSLDPAKGICSALFRSANEFELKYGSDCGSGKNCGPVGRSIGYLPAIMSFGGIQCSDKQKLRLVIGFSNTSTSFRYNLPMVPSTTLVGEGMWDEEKNRLSLVACRILNFAESLADASVGDCSIKLILRFPAILSIRNRNGVVGQIWSNSSMDDVGYFDRVLFQSSQNRMLGGPGLKYEYTEIGRAMNSCGKNNVVRNKGNRYPDGYSYDMRFDMLVKDNQGKKSWGYAVPLTVRDQFYEHSLSSFVSVRSTNANSSRYLNISYTISFTPDTGFSLGEISSNNMSLSLKKRTEIAAEGSYDTKTGSLCMIGCRSIPQKSTSSDSMDCDILIDVQFPPLNANSGETVKGTIKSMRKNSDRLYFEHLEMSSTAIYTNQAKESIWRMDLEITMVLITNTLVCVFVGLQLFYVKKHPDVIPSISLVMLVILTLGHMIPLVLNFEALFVTNRNRQNVLIGSGGWLEVNEVIVRVVTMVAFLLQFRLLQLTWSTRLADENQKGLWVAEKKALLVSLPLFLVGGFIAMMIHWLNNDYKSEMLHGRVIGYQRHSLLGDLRSYAGLVLDCFLFPQIMLNLFLNSKDKALSSAFYVGTTTVRLLPHAYDLYRAHGNSYSFDASYIYANHGGDFFSTAWDVIIPCGGLLFAGLIYLQQQFGGRCILPQRFRDFDVYEKVPVVSGK